MASIPITKIIQSTVNIQKILCAYLYVHSVFVSHLINFCDRLRIYLLHGAVAAIENLKKMISGVNR